MRATIREVAERAGVAPCTVSRVLNGHDADHMRPETKERILASIRELDYRPVKAAQRLRRQRTHALGILVPDITNLYFALLIRGIESVASERGFTSLICDSSHDPRREARYLDMLLAEDAEGVLLVPTGRVNVSAVERLSARDVRVMLVDRRIEGFPVVEADNRGASRALGEHILKLGYRRVGYISGPAEVSTAEDRLSGFRDAFDAAGVRFIAVERGAFTFESGFDAARKILRKEKVDAVVAANDLMAFGVLRAAEEEGLAVPGDIGVAGFDHVPHVPYATFLRPELTTVDVPVDEMGREAARRLLAGADDPLKLATRLVPRRDVRRAKEDRVIGKATRLARLFRSDGRAVVIALDHGQFKGPMPGLESMPEIVRRVVDGGADGIILNAGAVESCVPIYAGRCSLIVRVTGASTDANPAFDYHRQILSVEEAVTLGADAVIAMGFLGSAGEAPSLALLADIAESCRAWGMPLVAEMLVAEPSKFHDVPTIALGARVAFELGADVVKAYGAGEPAFAEIPKSSPLPVLVAGGAQSADPAEMARQVIARGAAGVAFGRTVFGTENPTQVVQSLVKVVHGKGG